MGKKTPKQRPKSTEDLVQAIRVDRLDGRTKESKELQKIKAGLVADPLGAAKSLLRSLVASNMVIYKQIEVKALSEGLFDREGKLNPLVQKELLKFQGASKTALIELLKLEGSSEDPGDIFNDVFDD